MVAESLFWLAGAGVVYTFLGYPVLMSLLARIAPRPVRRENVTDGTSAPEVCVIIVVHNEEKRVAARVEDLLASDYPHERLRVLVVSDGSTDATVARVAEFENARVGVLERATREGKSACLNEALEVADAEIVVFAD